MILLLNAAIGRAAKACDVVDVDAEDDKANGDEYEEYVDNVGEDAIFLRTRKSKTFSPLSTSLSLCLHFLAPGLRVQFLSHSLLLLSV